jgi:nitrogen fixation protein NifX
MDAPLSRDVALRIGLAARALADIEVKNLLELLLQALGEPLTEAKLDALTVKDLKQLGLDKNNDELKAALACLRGQEINQAALPEIQARLADENSILVACASNTAAQLDGHFGSCARFLIYQVSANDARLIDIRNAHSDSLITEDKNAFRVELIGDCHVLYVVSIGGPAAAKVVRKGLHPIKQPQGGDCADIIAQLQQILATAPPPWLAKVMGVTAEQRTRFSTVDESNES